MREKDPNYKMKKYESFLNVKDGLTIDDVSEPTDIIWENRSITDRTRCIRRLISYLVIAFALFLSGCAIFSL